MRVRVREGERCEMRDASIALSLRIGYPPGVSRTLAAISALPLWLWAHASNNETAQVNRD